MEEENKEYDSEAQQKKDLDMLDRHCMALQEHFDTVQIFATRHEGNKIGTVTAQSGKGNWFARFGQVKLWCNDQEYTKEESDE